MRKDSENKRKEKSENKIGKSGENKEKEDEPNLEDELEKVQKALSLLGSESADEIVGDCPEEWEVLIQGTKALGVMNWLVMKEDGLKETPKSLKHQAQGSAMGLTLVHYAFALGIEHGRKKHD